MRQEKGIRAVCSPRGGVVVVVGVGGLKQMFNSIHVVYASSQERTLFRFVSGLDGEVVDAIPDLNWSMQLGLHRT